MATSVRVTNATTFQILPFSIRRLGLRVDAIYYSRIVPIPENRQKLALAVTRWRIFPTKSW